MSLTDPVLMPTTAGSASAMTEARVSIEKSSSARATAMIDAPRPDRPRRGSLPVTDCTISRSASISSFFTPSSTSARNLSLKLLSVWSNIFVYDPFFAAPLI